MAGIKETKEMVNFAIELGHAADRSLADGKLGFDDVGHLVTALTAAGPAFADANQIGAELADMDEAESAELDAFVKNKLQLSNPKVEKIAEVSLELGLKIYELIQLLKADEEPAPEEVAVPTPATVE